MNRFYGQQQTNIPQPMEMTMQQQNTPQMTLNRQNILYGKQVDSLEVVKAIDIPLDGSVSYFPLANGSAIVTKQLQQDGTSKITIYEPKTQKNDIKFATIEDIDKRLEKLDFSEIDDLKDDLEDLKKELKDIKNKLKTKKED
ncbi:MAG: hypothetical protein SOZ53_05215 [Candidatus Onthovivens sp.]|uniref:hypothetical protein n=1 Tax=Terrisporobacter sp. TaxID=1965305 RepID=UPI002A7EA814|nr:hypothetical protein [Terrisporobacter sp.]MDY3778231.1 hypothetical protein [Candidatus Onthovivens sp.]MDY3828009.1 hypothetical protein [Clostridium sp.]MDY4136481.1 hypothetical protein [Terrisporobacter sp.]